MSTLFLSNPSALITESWRAFIIRNSDEAVLKSPWWVLSSASSSAHASVSSRHVGHEEAFAELMITSKQLPTAQELGM